MAPARRKRIPAVATPAWAFDRSFSILESAFRIRSDIPRLGTLLDRYLAPFRSNRAHVTETYVLTRDGEHSESRYPFVVYVDRRRVQSAPSYADLLDYVLARVHHDAIERTERFLAVHASAASWKGEGVVLPAPMDSGKTTLVAGLVRAGFDYLSDEAALFEARTGALHPFPKVLWMESSSVRQFPEIVPKLPREYRAVSRPRTYVRPGDLRAGSVGRPCRVRFVVAPSYRKGARTLLEPVSRAEAAMMLVRNAFNFSSFGGSGLRILSEALPGAGCYRLQMGDLTTAVDAVSELFRGPGEPAPTQTGG